MSAVSDETALVAERISSHIADFPHERIITGSSVRPWGSATHDRRWEPRIVARPRRRDEIAALVKGLGAFGPIGAIGQGRNIGLGGRLGAHRIATCIDLRDLRTIRHYDPVLGTITVEAGTTFQDVHDFLTKEKSDFFLPAIGGPSDASVVGNALQRGDGIGPGGDREASILHVTAVLEDGTTRVAGRDPTATETDPRRRLGPGSVGLFVQSRLGIVTEATLALTRVPNALLAYSIRFEQPNDLGLVVDLLRKAVGLGILQPSCGSLWSEGKVAARAGAALSPNRNRWFLSGAFYGSSTRRVEADWQDLVETIASIKVAHTIVARSLEDPVVGRTLYTGRPSDDNLAQLDVALPSDLRGRAEALGFAWVCPVLPFEGAAACEAMAIISPLLRSAVIPENIAFHLHSPRELRAFVGLSWNRLDLDQDRRAHECHDALLDALNAAGFPPFRIGHLST